MVSAHPSPAANPGEPPPQLRLRVGSGEAGVELPVAPDQTLLQALLAQGLDWPRSCRNGTCRTCLGRLGGGRVRYTVEWPGLSAEEKAEGCVLPCVAVPLEDVTLLPP